MKLQEAVKGLCDFSVRYPKDKTNSCPAILIDYSDRRFFVYNLRNVEIDVRRGTHVIEKHKVHSIVFYYLDQYRCYVRCL